MSNVVWFEESQKFITIPDGDDATCKQIKEHYEKERYKGINRYLEEGKMKKGGVNREPVPERPKTAPPASKLKSCRNCLYVKGCDKPIGVTICAGFNTDDLDVYEKMWNELFDKFDKASYPEHLCEGCLLKLMRDFEEKHGVRRDEKED